MKRLERIPERLKELNNMPTASLEDILDLIGSVIGNQNSVSLLNENSALLGAIPELDSMAVVNLMLGLEQRYGFHVYDEEVEVEIFETVGSLLNYARRKLDVTHL